MMFVAKLDRLGLHNSGSCAIVGTGEGKTECCEKRNEEYSTKYRDFGKGVGARMKYLAHKLSMPFPKESKPESSALPAVGSGTLLAARQSRSNDGADIQKDCVSSAKDA
jgi:hypothetical protein